MSVQKEQSAAQTVTQDAGSVYQSLFNKINLNPVAAALDMDKYEDNDVLSESSTDERVTMAVNILLKMIQDSSQKVEKLDKHLLDISY